MAYASELSNVLSKGMQETNLPTRVLGFERYQGVSLEQKISTMAAQNIAKGVVKMEGCY
jgi:hypothetical protein